MALGGTWERRPLRNLVVRPLQEFLQLEAAGGVLLLAAAVAALVWANLPGDSYAEFWHREVVIDLGFVTLDLTLEEWISDGLMAIFFFVVGLEIKRELLRGELADRKRAALPAAAALGGMIVPAAIYAALNAGGEGAAGWGIPMATDIAFAVGLLALLGSRVPIGLKVFLLALAIVDDLGAIAVIAIFYTDDLALGWLLVAVAALALISQLGRAGVRDLIVYIALALVTWLAVHESGVHATVAGVALGLLTPIEPAYDAKKLGASVDELVAQFTAGREEGTPEGIELANAALRDLEELARESQSPLDRLEHALHPWSSFLIVPLFALASAGVSLSGGALRDAASSAVSWGVILGLVIGKPTGIFVASYLAVRSGWASLPSGATWRQMLALGMIGGVGFTVALFISTLAFDDAQLVMEAKTGVLAGSALMGVAGLAALRMTSPEPELPADDPAVEGRAAG